MDILSKSGAILKTVEGGSLQNASLRGADLQDAELQDADLQDADLRGANLRGANLRGANLRGASLRGANLQDAELQDADLQDADLWGANLRGANLRGAKLPDAPCIPNIHRQVFEAASQPNALSMHSWHSCETTHCRAGWVVTLAGEEGKELEEKVGTAVAATLIYAKSDPTFSKVPDFYATNEKALADMKQLAEREGLE